MEGRFPGPGQEREPRGSHVAFSEPGQGVPQPYIRGGTPRPARALCRGGGTGGPTPRRDNVTFTARAGGTAGSASGKRRLPQRPRLNAAQAELSSVPEPRLVLLIHTLLRDSRLGRPSWWPATQLGLGRAVGPPGEAVPTPGIQAGLQEPQAPTGRETATQQRLSAPLPHPPKGFDKWRDRPTNSRAPQGRMPCH